MAHLFYVSGDSSLAIRTLKLYVQVVSKGFEAGSLVLLPRSKDETRWIETLIQGARMLCRIACTKEGLEGLEEAREAGLLIGKAKEALAITKEGEGELGAELLLAEGVWESVIATKG